MGSDLSLAGMTPHSLSSAGLLETVWTTQKGPGPHILEGRTAKL